MNGKLDMDKHKHDMNDTCHNDWQSKVKLKGEPWPHNWKLNKRSQGLLKYKKVLGHEASPLKRMRRNEN